MSILEEIVENKRKEVQLLKNKIPLSQLKIEVETRQPSRSLLRQLNSDKDFHFICEVKKASPSKGIIQPNFDPLAQAQLYEKGGASAISVLTDEKYFMGKLSYLTLIRNAVSLPILRKDFIIDEYQIYESKVAGSDLILLIARILEKTQIETFCKLAADLNLEVLIEVVEISEIKKIPNSAKNVIVGINNRNLHTFETNIQNSLDLKPNIPGPFHLISESGIHNENHCRVLFENDFKGVLVGESLMRAESPIELLRKMKEGILSAK